MGNEGHEKKAGSEPGGFCYNERESWESGKHSGQGGHGVCLFVWLALEDDDRRLRLEVEKLVHVPAVERRMDMVKQKREWALRLRGTAGSDLEVDSV